MYPDNENIIISEENYRTFLQASGVAPEEIERLVAKAKREIAGPSDDTLFGIDPFTGSLTKSATEGEKAEVAPCPKQCVNWPSCSCFSELYIATHPTEDDNAAK